MRPGILSRLRRLEAQMAELPELTSPVIRVRVIGDSVESDEPQRGVLTVWITEDEANM